MKKIIIIKLLLLFTSSSSFSQNFFKLADFGLSGIHGKIDFKSINKKEKDEIVVCPINFEDQLPDICICSGKKINIYTSLGNGLYNLYKTIELYKPARKIETYLPTDYPLALPTFYDLKITYFDGEGEILFNRNINSFDSEPEPKVPKWNFLNDARAFVYDFTFVKSWQSDRNGQPHSTVTLGDVDNDGKNEMIYTFYQVVDSGSPQYRPTRMVVFECVGQDQFRIDWDTVLTNGGGNTGTHILTDFDRNGKKEFFAECTNPTNGWGTGGLFECSGPGKYRFWGVDEFLFAGQIVDAEYLDTMKAIDSTNNPGVWISHYPSGVPPNTFDRISPYKYWRKLDSPVFGYYQFKTLGGSTSLNYVRIPWRIDDIDVADIDNDGTDEIVLGNLTETIDYLDSTGISNNLGFEFKSIDPGAPLSGHWVFTKDFDYDGNNEIIACGVGGFSGSIGIVKHSGAPGENKFTTMWWDTTGLIMRPNWGIDSGIMKSKFTILYPTIDYNGPEDIENIITYSQNGTYDFYKSSHTILDTTSFIEAKLFDVDNDSEIEVISPTGMGWPPVKHFLCVFKKDIVTLFNNNSTKASNSFRLEQNYPNPFNPNTLIRYELPQSLNGIRDVNLIILKIFDIRGKEITTLVNQYQISGTYEVEFDGSKLSSGIYFYSLIVNGNIIDSKRMLYIK